MMKLRWGIFGGLHEMTISDRRKNRFGIKGASPGKYGRVKTPGGKTKNELQSEIIDYGLPRVHRISRTCTVNFVPKAMIPIESSNNALIHFSVGPMIGEKATGPD